VNNQLHSLHKIVILPFPKVWYFERNKYFRCKKITNWEVHWALCRLYELLYPV